MLRTAGRQGVLLDGRLELRRRIGAGGLAEVFSAWDRTTSSEVAVKLLHEHLADDASVRGRFRRELSIARSLLHPGIVRVFDLHEHRGRPFITMELLQGRTLHERLLRDGSGVHRAGGARRRSRRCARRSLCARRHLVRDAHRASP